MAAHEQNRDMLLFSSSSFSLSAWPQLTSIVVAMNEILSLFEIPEGLCRLENVTRASNDIVVRRKRLKFNFGEYYPLKQVCLR